MVYKTFQNLKLSALGLGTMRLPTINGDDSNINEELAREMFAYAMEHGINYYDTAWGYHGENSETVVGRLLAEYPREKFYLASKFPGYDLSLIDKVEPIFEHQLQKCGVDYFDFYLFHNVCELNIEQYLNEDLHIMEYLQRQKQNGRIRHLGFSSHGSVEVMRRFLEKYGDQMEFCQIQLNYIDWTLQNAAEKVALLNSHNIPIWVMEPVRGGQLATLSEEDTAILKDLRPDEETPAWAFRFLQRIPGVTVTLSGMSDMQQLTDNIKTYESEEPLNDAETDAIMAIASRMISKTAVPCTACRYCTTHCPQELNIPHLLSLYNDYAYSGGGFLAPMAISAEPEDKKPSACLGCRSCEAVCPQQIKISEILANFTQDLALERE